MSLQLPEHIPVATLKVVAKTILSKKLASENYVSSTGAEVRLHAMVRISPGPRSQESLQTCWTGITCPFPWCFRWNLREHILEDPALMRLLGMHRDRITKKMIVMSRNRQPHVEGFD